MLSEQGFLLTYLHNSFNGNDIERALEEYYYKHVSSLYESCKWRVCVCT